MGKTRKRFIYKGGRVPRTRGHKGGKVLASGGFGCVFSPALKCEGAKTAPSNSVSKLMTDKHALQEYEEIQKVGAKLSHIPRFKDYFLVFDASLCRPQKLTPGDLARFSSTCTALPKNHITQDNINQKLDQVMALTMPHGGLPVDDFLYADGSFRKISQLHTHLVELLRHGILPMNKRHIYHCDIKDSNILVAPDGGHLKTRLIDWGLAQEYSPGQTDFPKSWRNRPLQFNVPFSVVLFTDTFYQTYTRYLEEHKREEALNTTTLKPFLSDYLKSWMNERGAGHYKYINEVVYKLYSKEVSSVSEKSKPAYIETQVTLPLIVDYLAHALIHYTKFKATGELNLREYLNDVFVHIADVYGFVASYCPLMGLLFDHYDSLDKDGQVLFERVAHLMKQHMFAPIHAPYNMRELYKDLDAIGKQLVVMASKEGAVGGAKERKKSNKSHRSSRKHWFFKKKTMVKRFKHPIFLTLK